MFQIGKGVRKKRVYVVIKRNKNNELLFRSLGDNETVLGVFMDRKTAERFIRRRDPFNHHFTEYKIHETLLFE